MTLAGVATFCASKVLALLPVRWMAGLSRPMAAIAWRLAGGRRRVALTNLRLCFPEMSETERAALAREHFRAYMQAALEHGFLWNASAEQIQRYVSLHDEAQWRQYQDVADDKKRPVIWLCPHFIGLDAAAIRMSTEASGCTIYSTQSNPDIDRLIRRGRERFGTATLFSRSEGVKPIIRAMRQGLPFYYLPDMDFGARESVFVPFFGIDAATITAVSRLAKLTHAVVVPVIATQRPRGAGYDVRFYPALSQFPSGDDVLDATRVNAFIETRVRENIAQYLWTHKRFKTRPPGEASVY